MTIQLKWCMLALILVTLVGAAPIVLWAQAVPETMASGATTAALPDPQRASTAPTPGSAPTAGSSTSRGAAGASQADPVVSTTDSVVASTKKGGPTLPGEQPLASLLGFTLKAATAEFGAPAEVFPLRGKAAWEDDVVFYYPDHSYLFWFRDRVWQVRVDRRFTGTVLGLHMGETRYSVQSVLGQPFWFGSHSEIFILPNRGFPVRARLFFTDGRLSDLYVYRGDF